MELAILLSLATYRLTLLLVEDRGPFALLERLRHFLSRLHPELEQGLSCAWCVSVWMGALLSLSTLFLGYSLFHYVLFTLASSGFTVLIIEALHTGSSYG